MKLLLFSTVSSVFVADEMLVFNVFAWPEGRRTFTYDRSPGFLRSGRSVLFIRPTHTTLSHTHPRKDENVFPQDSSDKDLSLFLSHTHPHTHITCIWFQSFQLSHSCSQERPNHEQCVCVMSQNMKRSKKRHLRLEERRTERMGEKKTWSVLSLKVSFYLCLTFSFAHTLTLSWDEICSRKQAYWFPSRLC